MSASIRATTRPIHAARGGVAIGVALALLLSACGGGNNASQNATTTAQKPAVAKSAPKTAAPSPAQAQQAVQATQAAQAKLESMSVDQLLAEARTAVNQQRLVAPAGNNAFEYYEKALQKDPKNQVAQDALREEFSFGANAVEQSIGQNNFDEAQREIGLLASADPSNYTLTILRSKLDAGKKQQQREADLKAKQAADLAAKQAEEAKAAAAKAAAPPPAAQKPAAPPPQLAPAPVAQTPAPPPQPAGETRGAEVVTPAAPQYPVEAARDRTSGYAVVEFTVNPDGSVSGAHVINAQPARVFNNAAIEAVSRSKFKPALKDGQPVPSTLQRRITFNLGG